MNSAEEKWQRARLIPVTGIAGAEEQERRGTSVLLAVLGAVREFGRAITMRLGAPAGSVESFIEVEFVLGDRKVRPDGLIRVLGRGGRSWTALVEVKTGRNSLQAKQVDDYLEVARARGYDAVLTISTQLADQPGGHPLQVDRRKLKKVGLYHLSWSEIHTEALIEQLNHSVSDPDQAWLLSEFIRYLEEPKSGALEFDDMGPSWTSVRDAVANRTMRETDPAVTETVRRFDQLVAYAGMHLSQRLGVLVRPSVTRKELDQASSRLQAQVAELASSGQMSGFLVVPDAIAPIEVVADLRAGKISCHLAALAPRHRKTAQGRITWLIRQIPDPPADLMIQAKAFRAKQGGPSRRFSEVLEDPNILLDDPKMEIRELTLILIRTAGTKRGRGKGCFIDATVDLVEEFYRQVVQNLKGAVPTAPRVKPGETKESATDPVLAELLAEDPDSPVSPSDGTLREETVLDPAAQRLDLPELPAG